MFAVRSLCVWLSLLLMFSGISFAQEAVAQKVAEDILRGLSAGTFKTIWDQKVSKFFKDRVTENLFLSNMAMSRPMLGKLQSLQYVSTQHLNKDPQTGFEGDIYFVVFRTNYTSGDFFEHVAVVKDADGQYRFSGINGAPVPKT
jgi:hypothetical protein